MGMVPRGEKYKNASPNTFKKKHLIIYVMNSIKKSQKTAFIMHNLVSNESHGIVTLKYYVKHTLTLP